VRTSTRRSAICAVTIGVLAIALALRSRPRPIGDSGEYLAMALAIGSDLRPSLSPHEIAALSTRFPDLLTGRLDDDQFRAADGRQEFPHFWLYSLLAAPFIGVARAARINPLVGFAILNVLLLSGAALVVSRRASVFAAFMVLAGPILWWVDKAHTEVFTVAMLAIAMASVEAAPEWSIVAFGLAAAQNPPIVVGVAIATLSLRRRGPGGARPWLWLAVGCGIAALHPLYYFSRLGRMSGLALSIDRHVPTLRELLTVLIDPNIGLFIHQPVFAIALITGIVIAVRRRAGLTRPAWCAAGLAAVFLFAFTQTVNVNSGGTPGPSRYGLWLLPLALPWLAVVPARAQTALAIASTIYNVALFAPQRPEAYLQPTPLAAALWTRFPGLDNPVSEIFAERIAGAEPPPQPPLATPNCEKVLIIGVGGDALWPPRCRPAAVTDACRKVDQLCYANLTGNGYRFVRAPTSPSWFAQMSRLPAIVVGSGPITPNESPPGSHLRALWLDRGWSYLETSGDGPFAEQWRWMGDTAQVGVTTDAPLRMRLGFVARAYGQPRRLQFSVDDQRLPIVTISDRRDQYLTAVFAPPSGTSLIRLDSVDGTAQTGTADRRRLSIAIFRMAAIIAQ
jgi:hypothetical protein